LVDAIRKLFALNYYDIEGPTKLHGAEIDLVARRRGDPFDRPIYIEITIEYVDNDKYGKDAGKFLLVKQEIPGAQCLLVSADGFSLPVKERASKSDIKLLTYAELFGQFERFDTYVASVVGEGDLFSKLRDLNNVYEEPFFEDKSSRDIATEFLKKWRDDASGSPGWLIVTGEYGTGKTALTKILLYRWMLDYRSNPSLPIPLRIELRDFSRQFDARGLLHHFLDRNGLGHVALDFVYSLIKSGRVILILDGYDEMAQYLHARERRACLEALAELSAGGVKGILTSRPNYFTDAEEMQVFELLYSSLKSGHYFVGREARAFLEKEALVDRLLEQFLYKYEKSLRDLNAEQTEALVVKILKDDEQGQAAVLKMLRSIFRNVGSGDSRSLSGKPVIISYLLEVVEDLKRPTDIAPRMSSEQLTEWEVYRLIVDNLMLRDFRRSPELEPDERRSFLHKLSIFMSRSGHAVISEDEFRDVVSKEFSRKLRRYGPESKSQQFERYFADLRSSTTLTKSKDSGREGWSFSHNSLREYLVAEYLLSSLATGRAVPDNVSITDAMRLFSASRTSEELKTLTQALANLWGERLAQRGLGQLLTLLWDGGISLYHEANDPVSEYLKSICGNSLALNGVGFLSRIRMSSKNSQSDLRGANFSSSDLSRIDFSCAALNGADFSDATLDGVNFSAAELKGSRFSHSLIEDANFSEALVKDADFRGVKPGDISILVEDDYSESGLTRLIGSRALGFLNYNGAATDKISESDILRNHPKFRIAEKIIEKLVEQSLRQRRGLEQRGEARQDVRFARHFVDYLESRGLIRTPGRRKDIVEVTEAGREVFRKLNQDGDIPEVIVEFLRNEN
jgi:hypothetical protein